MKHVKISLDLLLEVVLKNDSELYNDLMGEISVK
jgi:hypothetical protein